MAKVIFLAIISLLCFAPYQVGLLMVKYHIGNHVPIGAIDVWGYGFIGCLLLFGMLTIATFIIGGIALISFAIAHPDQVGDDSSGGF